VLSRHKRLRGIGRGGLPRRTAPHFFHDTLHALLLLDLPDPRRMSGIRNPLGDHIMSKNTPIPTTRRFDVFVVEDYTKDGEEKANWVRVGVAFENKDGKGFNVQLTALPVGGKLVMRVHEPRPGA
jgi:hypothetical protein